MPKPKRERPTGLKYRTLPKELKEHAKKLLCEGHTAATVAGACPGLPLETALRWKRQMDKAGKIPKAKPSGAAEFLPSAVPKGPEAEMVVEATERRNVRQVIANTLEVLKRKVEEDMGKCVSLADQLEKCLQLDGIAAAQEFIEARPPIETWSEFNAVIRNLRTANQATGEKASTGINASILKMRMPKYPEREALRSGAKPMADAVTEGEDDSAESGGGETGTGDDTEQDDNLL